MTSRARKLIGTALITVLLLAGLAPTAVAAEPGPRTVRAFDGARAVIRARDLPIVNSHRAEAPALTANSTPTADIQVTYAGFSPDAQAAFEAAVTVWESLLVSSQPIHVAATWKPLGTGVLGSAGPTEIVLRDDNYWYPVAVAEALCACESGDPVEIETWFNSTFSNWYLGTDGNTPSNKYDLFTVVMHELGHGLGLISSFDVVGSYGYWGYSHGLNLYPLRFDTYEYSAASGGTQLISYNANGSTTLRSELTDGSVFFGGPNVIAALGSRAKLYAPPTWSQGSSNSHLDEATYGRGNAESLMTPALSAGEVMHSVGPVTQAVMRDVGWTTSSGPPPPTGPANDDFANATAVTVGSVSNATTADATLEVGEPAPSCTSSFGKSVWYSFTPTTTRRIIANTVGSNFDTVLAVYTGSSLGALTPGKCNDDRPLDAMSKIKMQVFAGTTYWFQVGGYQGLSGQLVFRVKTA